MKRSLVLAVAVSGVISGGWVTHAAAQSSVTLYGSLGDSVAYASNEHGKSVVFMGGGTTPEWVGMRGVEDLGDGLKAVFRLENGIVSATGSSLIPGESFGRLAYVGLQSSQYGQVTLGRQFDITNDFLMPISNGYQSSDYQLYHPANLDDLGSVFYNNAVKYTSANLNGVTFESMYGFDDSSSQPGRYVGAGVGYASGGLKAAAVYSAQHDRTIAIFTKLGSDSFLGQTLTNGSTFVARSVAISAVGAMYSITPSWSVRSMYSQVAVEAQTGNSTTMRTGEIGANFQSTAFNVVSAGGYYSSFDGGHYLTAALSDVYSLSKRTALFAEIAYQHSNGALAAMANLSPSSNHQQIATYVGTQLFF